MHLRYLKPDGTIIYLSVSAKPRSDEAGHFMGYRGVGSDITAAVEAARSLREEKDRAEIANLAKSQFLANMSHELRTPLNAIIGFSDIIKNRTFGADANDRYGDYAGDIHGAGIHLLSIIDEILDLSKIEAGREDLSDIEVDLSEIVTATRRLFGDRFGNAGLSLILEIPEPEPVLLVDARKIKQCLANLLSNALKFTAAGGTVTISAFEKDGGLAIAVSDTGIGIAARNISVVLSPFGQVESAFQRNHRGTGLGLPLTKALIELHGGALEIESSLGVGTTVTLTLPAARVAWPDTQPAALG
jgi:signal transduction histidine kinase